MRYKNNPNQKTSSISFAKFYRTVEELSNVKMIDRTRQAEVRNEGSGTPYQLVESSTLAPAEKEAIIQELTYGNPELLSRFMAYYQQHQLTAWSEKVTFDYALAGDYVDVGRYMSGEPECMVSFAEVRPTEFVDVLVNIDTLLNISQEHNIAYYAAALSAVDSLEKSGYRVKLSGVMYSDRVSCDRHPCVPVLPVRNQPVIHEVRVSIKDYQEPVNMAYLTSVCLGKTAFMRALVMRPDLDTSPLWGCDQLPGFADRFTPDTNTVYIPSLIGNAKDGYAFATHPLDYFKLETLMADWNMTHLLA